MKGETQQTFVPLHAGIVAFSDRHLRSDGARYRIDAHDAPRGAFRHPKLAVRSPRHFPQASPTRWRRHGT
jgi:hypothetical protein